MKAKAVVTIVAFLLAGLWLAAPAMAQHKGHTGGLGESRIHFNIATAANLAKAPGITPAIADAIVKYREEKGPIKKGDDLLNVPGITKDVLKEINPQVGTEGDLFTVPRPGEELEDDGDVPLAPSKC
jgi:competence ComEA-like helix-hairpin-helix protein